MVLEAARRAAAARVARRVSRSGCNCKMQFATAGSQTAQSSATGQKRGQVGPRLDPSTSGRVGRCSHATPTIEPPVLDDPGLRLGFSLKIQNGLPSAVAADHGDIKPNVADPADNRVSGHANDLVTPRQTALHLCVAFLLARCRLDYRSRAPIMSGGRPEPYQYPLASRRYL